VCSLIIISSHNRHLMSLFFFLALDFLLSRNCLPSHPLSHLSPHAFLSPVFPPFHSQWPKSVFCTLYCLTALNGPFFLSRFLFFFYSFSLSLSLSKDQIVMFSAWTASKLLTKRAIKFVYKRERERAHGLWQQRLKLVLFHFLFLEK